MYYYRPIGINSAKIMADEEREEKQKEVTKKLAISDESFLQISNKIISKNPDIVAARLKEFYDQIIKADGELLEVDNDIREIYVKLLNFQVPKKALDRLAAIEGSIQYIRGNDKKQSKIVNMDYFSVRIDKMPIFGGQPSEVGMLFKKIRDNFLTLSKGSKVFESKCLPYPTIKGSWEFKPYPKNPKEELKRWNNELGGSIFLIDASSAFVKFGHVPAPVIINVATLVKDPADDGAVLESEISQNSWIFTTVFTPKSDTQPFSGHRQFGIHKDEEGDYRFFTRAIDRVWPSEFISMTNGRECSVENYFIVADATWSNLIKNVSEFIRKNGGKTTIMESKPLRIDFNNFFKKFRSNKSVNFIGNIEQYKN